MRRCYQRARQTSTQQEMTELANEVSRAIEPINIAGLNNPQRRNWYPVDASDLLNSAAKLGSTKHEISQLLDKCGFWK
jgi:FADH2 O2-dependent halogenase